MSLAQAQARVDAVMARLRQDFRENGRDHRTMRVVPLHADVVRGSAAAVYVLMGAAGLVLLIACLNVANLFLARSLAQTRQIAIRTALGAGGARLAGPHLAESLLVALTGGVVGSGVAFGGVKLLLAVSPESLARAEEVGFDLRLLGFALATTVLTTLIFGAAPSIRATRVDPSQALHDGERGSTGGRGSRRARSALVASQVAVALVLLVGAGLLMRSFIALQQVPLGFAPDHVATFEVHLSTPRYAPPERRIQLHEALHEKLREIPGVEAVGATSWLPANGHYHQWGFGVPDATGRRQWSQAQVRVVDGDFFAALRIPLLAGRTFTPNDRLATDGVALIDQSLAKTVYGTRDPLGTRFMAGGREFTVIGVVGTVAYQADGTPFPMVYLSHAQFANDRNWALTYVVRTAIPPERIVEPARRALAALDPALVLYRPRSMDAVLARHRARDQFTLLLMATFAAIALSLAAVGVYGVLSYAVTQRTHEIGVRMALGARPREVRALVVRQGLIVAGLGMLAGLGGAWALSRMLGSLVHGVSTRDPLVFAGVALVLAAVIGAAGYLPTRRATRVDPLEAMRGA